MSLWSQITNVFRGSRLNHEIDEELRFHLEEAVAQGRDPQEAARAFGSLLRSREASRDVRLVNWLDSLRADAVFSWRQVLKHKTASAAAILSLALAIGSCTGAFRLIDALLLRPLPVNDPSNLYVLAYSYTDDYGHPQSSYDFSYPCFQQLRAAMEDKAVLLAISERERMGLSFGSENTPDKAYRQYVSGLTFSDFGLKPALGRIFTAADDVKPEAHPVAILSYDFWTRRFGQDKKIIGRTFRSGTAYEVIGIAPKGFTGTETGGFTDVFYTTMANTEAINSASWNWFRIWVRPKPGVPLARVRETLHAALAAFRREQVKSWNAGHPKEDIEQYVNAPVSLEGAAAGVSHLQQQYKAALAILAALVCLVLLIACANVANLMLAQASSRAREMALRVSLGAGRARLVQLVLVESAMIALAASMLGALFAWQAAPFIVGMINSPDDPARLALPADWRILTFATALALMVTLLFGLAPALRASAVKPAAALKGGEDPHARRRLTNALVAAQVAFCFFVYHAAGLFVTTFERMANQPTGFSTARVLTLETATKGKESIEHWDSVTERLRSLAGVESVGLCWWPLMSGNGWDQYIWANGHAPDASIAPYFLKVSPGWLETMRIPLIGGRDFRPDDAFPQVAIVNELFARRYFNGQNPVGRSFELIDKKKRCTLRIVGLVRDARYRDMREPIRQTAYVPFRSTNEEGQDWASFIVRTKTPNPMAMASLLRQEVARTQPSFQVVNVRTQEEMVQSHLLRERLLAALALFFAGVAVTLAGVGLYGVLNYAVIRSRRELGIRMAIGAGLRHVTWRVTSDVFAMIVLGMAAGLAAGIYCARFVESLLYQVKPADPHMLGLALFIVLAVASLAAVPPAVRAARIDPAAALREE